MAVKVYTMSDLHVDYEDNLKHLLQLSRQEYHDSALIVSGDVTDDMDKLQLLLRHFTKTFAHVFYVPGNHELWVRGTNRDQWDSIAKFNAIIDMCNHLGIHTTPTKLSYGDDAVWVVPLFSWYTKAEDGIDTLYKSKPGNDQTEMMWVDNRCCDWSALPQGKRVVDHFLELNEPHLSRHYDAPVISFSHFLPLKELIFPLQMPTHFIDPMPQFNFTRVAGSTLLNEQIKQLGSTIHIYGHQHRNRHRDVDGITYISHCLGYPRERQKPIWHGDDKPKLVWHQGKIDISKPF